MIQQELKNLSKILSDYSYVLGVVNESIHKSKSKEKSITNSELLMIHELGSPIRGIPPRPILQYAIDHEQIQEILDVVLEQCIEFYFEGKDVTIPLKQGALRIESFIRKALYNGDHNLTPLLPSTIKSKGSDLPLIDTGQLARSIVCQLIKRKGE